MYHCERVNQRSFQFGSWARQDTTIIYHYAIIFKRQTIVWSIYNVLFKCHYRGDTYFNQSVNQSINQSIKVFLFTYGQKLTTSQSEELRQNRWAISNPWRSMSDGQSDNNNKINNHNPQAKRLLDGIACMTAVSLEWRLLSTCHLKHTYGPVNTCTTRRKFVTS